MKLLTDKRTRLKQAVFIAVLLILMAGLWVLSQKDQDLKKEGREGRREWTSDEKWSGQSKDAKSEAATRSSLRPREEKQSGDLLLDIAPDEVGYFMVSAATYERHFDWTDDQFGNLQLRNILTRKQAAKVLQEAIDAKEDLFPIFRNWVGGEEGAEVELGENLLVQETITRGQNIFNLSLKIQRKPSDDGKMRPHTRTGISLYKGQVFVVKLSEDTNEVIIVAVPSEVEEGS